MATTNFVDNTTLIEAAWLNDVNAVTYDSQLGLLAAMTTQQATDLATIGTAAFRTAVGLDNAFSAYLPADQTVVSTTLTKITLDTEEFDISNTFTSYRFTPDQPGYYQLNYAMVATTNIANGVVLCTVYKNGTRFRDGTYTSISSNSIGSTGSTVVYLNGTTDYVELYGYVNGVTILGLANRTHFSGFRIG